MDRQESLAVTDREWLEDAPEIDWARVQITPAKRGDYGTETPIRALSVEPLKAAH